MMEMTPPIQSKMSFSYWGADNVSIHKPVVKPRQTSDSSRKGALLPLECGRESSANASAPKDLLQELRDELRTSIRNDLTRCAV